MSNFLLVLGVFTSCVMNIVGVVVFLRTGWMVVRYFIITFYNNIIYCKNANAFFITSCIVLLLLKVGFHLSNALVLS